MNTENPVRHKHKRYDLNFKRSAVELWLQGGNHRYAIALFAAAYNFCKVHSTPGCTPAIGLKLTNEA